MWDFETDAEYLPFVSMTVTPEALGLADGPSEVHKITLAPQGLSQYAPVETLFPSGHLPTLAGHARLAFAARLEHETADL